MPDLKTVLTETQLGDMQFRVELALQAAESDCLEAGQIPGYPMWADAAINAMFEYLAGLPGVAVVQIPEPDEREDEDQEFSDFPGIGLYVPVVFDRHPGEVQIRAGAWCDEPLSVAEARELAASILAAAALADRPREESADA